MTYVSIPAASREVGEPVTKDLIDTIHYNLEDINTRLGAVSDAAGSAVYINEILRAPLDNLPVGTIVHASLTAPQFTTDSGEWVAANGADVTGSDWALLTGRNVLPDVRGRFIRAKDNGVGNTAVDSALDSYTADTLKSHLHDMGHGHANTIVATNAGAPDHFHVLAKAATATGPLEEYNVAAPLGRRYMSTAKTASTSFDYDLTGTSEQPDRGITAFGGAHTHAITMSGGVTSHSGNTGLTGAAETAPRYITENVFIKINRAYIKESTVQYAFRVPQRVTLNNIVVSPIAQGSNGNFQIDIKKGSSPTTASQSIFQTSNLPTLPWNGSVGVTGLTDSNQNTLEAGQWMIVSIASTQAKLKGVHLFCAGDY